MKKIVFILLFVFCNIGTCKPIYPSKENLSIESTISSDGQIIAVLSNSSEKNKKLNILRLSDSKGWQELPLPRFTTSIRFGLQGHNLLLTHKIPGDGLAKQLTKWNLDDWKNESEALFEGPALDFPLQISSTEYMVRTCRPFEHEKICKNGATYFWILFDSNKQPVKVGAASNAYSQPNIFDRGFFWVKQAEDLTSPILENATKRQSPRILSYALPNGTIPIVDSSKLKRGTTDLSCDKQMKRCLRKYNKNDEEGLTGRFIYEIEIFFGSESCHAEGISGYSDGMSITPDGSAAVISLAADYDQPRHIVLMKFDNHQCKPMSIQHLFF